MTQDLGTALARFSDYREATGCELDQMAYVVGNEQDRHFQVLFAVLRLLRPELDGRLHHISYGMVELPEGKMKSREGTVVDADDLITGLQEEATASIRERFPGLPEDELQARAPAIGLAALKYYILDFTPRSTVHFDPEKSVDFQGRTGAYMLYNYARIRSIYRRIEGAEQVLESTRRAQALRALGTEHEMAVVRADDALSPPPRRGFPGPRPEQDRGVAPRAGPVLQLVVQRQRTQDHRVAPRPSQGWVAVAGRGGGQRAGDGAGAARDQDDRQDVRPRILLQNALPTLSRKL